MVLSARVIDRIGKGIRGAPRDALVADIAPAHVRGAAYGLRQSLDTVGAFAGPLLAMALMLAWSNDFRAVFWVAIVPGLLAVAILLVGVREPERPTERRPRNPIRRRDIARLSGTYWWVVALGAVVTLARFQRGVSHPAGARQRCPIGLGAARARFDERGVCHVGLPCRAAWQIA